MTKQQRNEKIISYLKSKGYRPRENKDINNYIKQLRDRLRKQNKDLFIEETNDELNIYIGEKKDIVKRNKALYVRVNDEEEQKYKELAIKKNTDLSKLIRELLNEECSK